MGGTEMLGDRWEQEVTGPQGKRVVVVAVRRHDALHSGDSVPYDARGQEAALVMSLLATTVRGWR